MKNSIEENNRRVLTLLSDFLNNHENYINTNLINKITQVGVSDKQAFILLLSSFYNLDDEDDLLIYYFPYMINELNENDYYCNEYYKNIGLTKKRKKIKNWEITTSTYKAYEAFVCNDFIYMEDKRIIPQIGYFKKPFRFLSVYENKRLWMSITPNEIETMKKPIELSRGIVCTIGLGLGYFTYMCSLKENVKKVIVIEIDKNIINLFKNTILPDFSFEQKNKIEIINADAFTFLDNDMDHLSIDYLFTDIWHDVSDGKDLYKRIKEYESKYNSVKFMYWIENTIKYYL